MENYDQKFFIKIKFIIISINLNGKPTKNYKINLNQKKFLIINWGSKVIIDLNWLKKRLFCAFLGESHLQSI